MKKSFGDRIEELRGDKTQKQFAVLLGIPLNTYTNWTRGIRFPTADAVVKICIQLGVSSDWLLGLSNTPPKALEDHRDQAGDPSGKGVDYWRTLAISQQETISKLTALLAEGRAIVAAPVRTGGRGVTKTA
jgi:transcriptional regulator with XRE-family HTH domain